MFLCVSGGSRAARIASSKTFFSPRYSEEEKEENSTVSKANRRRDEQIQNLRGVVKGEQTDRQLIHGGLRVLTGKRK